MMKKILPSLLKTFALFSLFLGITIISTAQTVDITTNPGTSGNVVVGGSTYHASEAIFQESEIGASNFITTGTAINRIAFSLAAAATVTVPKSIASYKIYMQNVSDSLFVDGNYDLTNYTLVFNGTINLTTKGAWNTVDLTTPFVRVPGTNLQILIIRTNAAAVAGCTFNCSVGTPSDGNLLTTRRYNSSTVPSTLSSLVASNFRYALQLSHAVATDVKPSVISLPSSSCFSSPQSITVTITNSGTSNAIATGAVSVKLNIYGANAVSLTQTSAGSIAVGATQNITFPNVSIANVGSNLYEVITTLVGDADASNDTLYNLNSTYVTNTVFPAIEHADNSNFQYFSHVKTLAGSSLWTYGAGIDNPDLSNPVPAQDGDTCYIFDNWSSTSSSSGFSARLFSDCFTLPAGLPANNYQLNFWLTHDTSYPTLKDSIYVTISNDKGLTWTRLKGYARYDAAFTTADWREDSISLSTYAGQTIMIGFEGVSKWGNMQGLDNITVRGNDPLPIKLSVFNGYREGLKNILAWTTVSEQNNKGFELQRSANGKEFEKIAFIESKANAGNSSAELQYSYVDNKTLDGNNYYRLRQIDNNGKESYSNVVLLKSSKTVKAEITKVYPNPVSDRLNVTLNTVSAEKITVTITDIAGKTISIKNVETTIGDNNLNFNVSNLTKGTYFVKVKTASNIEIATEKFVKL